MTFTDAELDALLAQTIHENRFLSDSRAKTASDAAEAITYLRNRDPIGAVIMQERAAEIADRMHNTYILRKGRNPEKYHSQYSQLARNIRALPIPTQAEVLAYARALIDAEPRKQFPILNGRGAKIDWQLVADHGEQAHQNHGQTVARLAERGGLSWCELFAVLHNKRWEKMDTNDAMVACRALEARYLAALEPKP